MRKCEPLMPSRPMAEDGSGYLFIVVDEGKSEPAGGYRPHLGAGGPRPPKIRGHPGGERGAPPNRPGAGR
ncbi:MAG: hypothetical protein QGG53_07570, partial [Planctomycetota bacterium]|nr:hypothetical protein [Planctomycetota bacterium]